LDVAQIGMEIYFIKVLSFLYLLFWVFIFIGQENAANASSICLGRLLIIFWFLNVRNVTTLSELISSLIQIHLLVKNAILHTDKIITIIYQSKTIPPCLI